MRPGRTDGTLAARLTEALEPRPEILEACLFGSRARGDAHSRSDVDVAVYYVDDARAAAGPFGYQADLTTHLMTTSRSSPGTSSGGSPEPPHRT